MLCQLLVVGFKVCTSEFQIKLTSSCFIQTQCVFKVLESGCMTAGSCSGISVAVGKLICHGVRSFINEKMKMKNGLLRIAAQCWIIHETLKH